MNVYGVRIIRETFKGNMSDDPFWFVIAAMMNE